MGESLLRRLYRGLLRLHPEQFRREFGDDMLWIFDEISATKHTAPLFADAAGSLARQWLLRGNVGKLGADEPELPVLRVAAGPFAGEHILVPEQRLSARRLLQGSVVAAAFLAVLATGAVRSVTPLAVLAEGGQAPAGGIEPGILRRGVDGGVSGGVEGGVSGG
jgi:hypothetical protein